MAAKSSVVFLGTGTSSGNPHLNCLLGLSENQAAGGCDVCRKAARDGPPHDNVNYRNNPSICIKYDGKFILVDAGKTFRNSALTWFPRRGITHLDAVILTHSHADAIFGLDDLRLVQPRDVPLDVFASVETFSFIEQSFPYLVKTKPSYHGPLVKDNSTQVDSHDGKEKSATFVAVLNWNVMSTPSLDDSLDTFSAAGLAVLPLPVYHGPDYLSLGFVFGRTNNKFVYISDVSTIPDKIMNLLQSWDVRLLVIDTLHREKEYVSHMNLSQSLAVVEAVKPTQTYLVGVSHSFDHLPANEELSQLEKTKGLKVQIAHDGLELDLSVYDIVL
uniref:Metallo-beta-lactamase domain-containing protein n=2 Tax=Mucochytrium quahogii TaxID=96639 RepID=A0A7S2R7C0_9STRA